MTWKSILQKIWLPVKTWGVSVLDKVLMADPDEDRSKELPRKAKEAPLIFINPLRKLPKAINLPPTAPPLNLQKQNQTDAESPLVSQTPTKQEQQAVSPQRIIGKPPDNLTDPFVESLKGTKHEAVVEQVSGLPEHTPVTSKPPSVVQAKKFFFRLAPSESRKQEALRWLRDSSQMAQSGSLFNNWRAQDNFKPLWLSGEELKSLRLNGIDFQNCILLNVNFSHTSLVGANFQGAVLRRVNFDRADVTNANFQGVDLSATTNLRTSVSMAEDLANVNRWFLPANTRSGNTMVAEHVKNVFDAKRLKISESLTSSKNAKAPQNEPSKEAEEKAIQAEKLYLEGKMTVGQISQSLGVSKTTLYRYLRMRNVKTGKTNKKKR